MYKAVASLCRIGDQMREQDVVDYFIPMRKCPGGVENRTARNTQSGYVKMGPMVRRSDDKPWKFVPTVESGI
ncbi:hypothetical protein NL676_013680 [Syzygium grande]|nr:hypothetical protein NL676_013680 [Syzygium grande]